MKKTYEQPDVEMIRLTASSVITESLLEPKPGDDELTPLPFGEG